MHPHPALLYFAVVVATLTRGVSAQSNSACPYGQQIFGASIIYGLNQGGCYQCDGDDGAPMSGADLVNSCAAMCDSDEKCKSYSIAHPALAPFFQELNDDNDAAMNCCLEYDVIAQDHPLYLDSRDVDFETTNCGKQASCWNSFVRSEYLQDENPNCDQKVPVIPAATAGTAQHKGTATGSSGLALPKCRQVTFPDESLVGAKLFQMIAKRKSWFAEGCPLFYADDSNADFLAYLLDDAHNTCSKSIEMEEAKNRLDGPDDTPTDTPSFRPTPAPTPSPTDGGDSQDTSSSTARSHYAQLSLSVLAVTAYIMYV